MSGLTLTYETADINRKFARRAFYALSMTPDERGDQYIDGYMATEVKR